MKAQKRKSHRAHQNGLDFRKTPCSDPEKPPKWTTDAFSYDYGSCPIYVRQNIRYKINMTTFEQHPTIGYVLFSFKGRLSRTDFWKKGVLVLLPIGLLNALLMRLGADNAQIAFASLIFNLGMLFPISAVYVKRLHDRGRSALWLLCLLVPLVNAVVAIWLLIETWLLRGSPQVNRFGDMPADPKPLSSGLVGLFSVLLLLLPVAAIYPAMSHARERSRAVCTIEEIRCLNSWMDMMALEQNRKVDTVVSPNDLAEFIEKAGGIEDKRFSRILKTLRASEGPADLIGHRFGEFRFGNPVCVPPETIEYFSHHGVPKEFWGHYGVDQ